MKPLHITARHKMAVPLYNKGLNEKIIEDMKEKLMAQTFRFKTSAVKTEKPYPKNDEQSIILSLDVVLLDKKQFDELVILAAKNTITHE